MQIPYHLTGDAKDVPTQEEVTIHGSNDSVRRKEFNELVVRRYRLKHFQMMYDQRNRVGAEMVLGQRVDLDMEGDAKYVLDGTDGRLVWSCDTHFLDHSCIVPNRIGLDAILPRHEGVLQWEWKMDLRRRGKEFTDDHSTLGFDDKGRMLWVGTCQTHDVWLTWKKDELDHEDEEGILGEEMSWQEGSMRMDITQYKIAVLFMGL